MPYTELPDVYFDLLSLAHLVTTRKPFNYRDYLPNWSQKFFGNWRSHIHGDANWMTAREAQRVYSAQNAGLSLSRDVWLSREQANCNVLAFAPKGKGKTELVKRNILQLDGSTSVITSDIKGTIYRDTSGYLSERGYRIRVFQPDKPECSEGFNPYYYLASPDGQRRVAEMLVPSTGGDPFWYEAPRLLIFVSSYALSNMGSGMLCLEQVKTVLNKFVADKEYLATIAKRFVLPFDAHLYDDLLFLLGADEETMTNVLFTAIAALGLWQDSKVRQVTKKDSLQLDQLRDEPTIVYVIVPTNKQEYYKKLLNLFYAVCFECAMQDRYLARHGEEPKRGLMLYLDEFGNLGKIENFSRAATVGREYGMGIFASVQSPSQIARDYGRDEAEAIIEGGLQFKLIYRGLSPQNAKDVVERLGYSTAYDNEFNAVSQYSHTLRVPLLHPWKICELPKNSYLLLGDDNRPLHVHYTPYFDDSVLRRRSEIPMVSQLVKPILWSPTTLDQGAVSGLIRSVRVQVVAIVGVEFFVVVLGEPGDGSGRESDPGALGSAQMGTATPVGIEAEYLVELVANRLGSSCAID